MSVTVKDLDSPDYDYFRHAHPIPERRLLAAIIARAVSDVLYDAALHPDQIRHAADFLFAPSSTYDRFGFSWICQQLEFNPNYLRQSILERLGV